MINRSLFKTEHSVFYVCRKKENTKWIERKGYQGCYEKHKDLIQKWIKYHKGLKDSINRAILNTQSDRKVYMFGAHAFSQFLLAFGVDGSRIIAVLDNDKGKQGKRLYGTQYKVFSIDALKDEYKPLIILRAGTHNKEIMEGILNINETAEFV